MHVAKNNVSGKARPTVIGDRVTVGHGSAFHPRPPRFPAALNSPFVGWRVLHCSHPARLHH